MFNKNNIEKFNKDKETTEKINQDFFVRNMPSLQNFNKAPMNGSRFESGGELLGDTKKSKSNFKVFGVLIIFGGLALIGGLVYISYIFIIKPSSTKVVPEAAAPAAESYSSIVDTINSNREAGMQGEISVVDTASNNVVATTTPVVLDLATSSASSTVAEQTAIGRTETAVIDTDNDGLSDDEERILGTNPEASDSNSNGYADLVEINNGYDPAFSGKLATNPNLKKYSNSAFNYEILYPKDWQANVLNSEMTTVFTAADGSIIQISVQENTDGQGILGWYGNMFPSEALTYDKLKSADSWEGIWGSDGLNFYLTDRARENIYVVSFVSPASGRAAYLNIYKLMIDSLTIK